MCINFVFQKPPPPRPKVIHFDPLPLSPVSTASITRSFFSCPDNRPTTDESWVNRRKLHKFSTTAYDWPFISMFGDLLAAEPFIDMAIEDPTVMKTEPWMSAFIALESQMGSIMSLRTAQLSQSGPKEVIQSLKEVSKNLFLMNWYVGRYNRGETNNDLFHSDISLLRGEVDLLLQKNSGSGYLPGEENLGKEAGTELEELKGLDATSKEKPDKELEDDLEQNTEEKTETNDADYRNSVAKSSTVLNTNVHLPKNGYPSIILKRTFERPGAGSKSAPLIRDFTDFEEAPHKLERLVLKGQLPNASCQCVQCSLSTHEPPPGLGEEYRVELRQKRGDSQLKHARYILMHTRKISHSAPPLLEEDHFYGFENLLLLMANMTYIPTHEFPANMSTDFIIGLLKSVESALQKAAEQSPNDPWLPNWKLIYQSVIMGAMPFFAHNNITKAVRELTEANGSEISISFFCDTIFEQCLQRAGVDINAWNVPRDSHNPYLPHWGSMMTHVWQPVTSSWSIDQDSYDVMNYFKLRLEGDVITLWSEWCDGLYGQMSVSKYEQMRFELERMDDASDSFEIQCPIRGPIIAFIVFGVSYKKCSPQLLVDYLQTVLLINAQPDLRFLNACMPALINNLYPHDAATGKYKVSTEDLLSCNSFTGDFYKNRAQL